MKSGSLYQDYDALAYKPHNVGEERGAINHIKKAKQKTKGLEIVFDPKQHKEFVTGFRKRKQQRRKEANKQLEKKAKKQRLEQRAERRKELKEQLGLPEDYGIQDSDGEQGAAAGQAGGAAAAAANADVKQYQQAGYTTTVSVTNLNTGFSSDEDPAAGEESDQEEEEEQQQERGPRQQQQQQQARGSGHSKMRHGKSSKKGVKRHRKW